jgi:hypothetical protein
MNNRCRCATLFKSIEVAGDAYQIGRGLGEAAARAFRETVVEVERYRVLKRDWSGSERLMTLLGAARQAYPDYLREIEGIADGAGASFEDVFLWNCRGDFPGGGSESHAHTAGCTTVMLPGAGDAPAIIAHNEDDQAELDGHCFMVRVIPSDGIAFTSFYSPGLLPGHTFAVNDAGLVQTINNIRPHDQQAGIPRHIIARAVLACADMDAALAVLGRRDRASGFHHNLGQAGDSRLLSVEAPASVCVARHVVYAAVHTNHLVFSECADIAQEVADSSAHRQRRAEALISDGALDGRDALVILGDDADEDLPICRKRRDGTDPGYTLACAVFEMARDRVAWRVHGHPREAAALSGIQHRAPVAGTA